MKKLEEIIRKIKHKQIKSHHVNLGIGLPCLKCLTENPDYNKPTINPVVITYKENGHWTTVYFHEKCLDELLRD